MSRTRKGSKPIGFEFWSKRPGKGKHGKGAYAKQLTHRTERQQNKPKPKDFEE